MKEPKDVRNTLDDFFAALRSSKWADQATLSFYTFSLDEFVLFDLLRTFDVPKQTRIVVFTDVVKHYNRGVVRGQYPNTSIIRIDVKEYSRRTCAVFHPKMIAISRGSVVERILLTSANLRNYHLGISATSVETLDWWRTKVPTESIPLLQRYLDQKIPKPIDGWRQDPETWTFTLGNDRRTLMVDVTPRCAWRIVQGLDARTTGVGVLAGGPFIAQNVVTTLATCGGSQSFWNLARGHHPLHAKFLQIGARRWWGSFNLTAQSFLGRRQATLATNVETIVVEDLAYPFEIAKAQLRKVLGKETDEVGLDDDVEPGDRALDEEDSENWRELKDLHRNAPLEVALTINGERISITVDPDWRDATSIRLSGEGGHAFKLKVRSHAGAIELKDAERAALRTLLVGKGLSLKNLSSPKIEGLRGGRVLWVSYLSLGIISSLTTSIRDRVRPSLSARSSKKKTSRPVVLDMRTVRNRVLIDDVDPRGITLLRYLLGDSVSLGWIADLKAATDE